MSRTVLVTGGARSGKSRIAEERALAMGRPAIYLATAVPGDDEEMKQRVAAHRARRAAADWKELPAPHDLAGALSATDGSGPRLVDCLTLWLANRLQAGADWEGEARTLAALLSRQRSPVVLVTNEVGSGIVPASAPVRAFRDAQGLVNQIIAAAASEVVLAVCGLPVKVK